MGVGLEECEGNRLGGATFNRLYQMSLSKNYFLTDPNNLTSPPSSNSQSVYAVISFHYIPPRPSGVDSGVEVKNGRLCIRLRMLGIGKLLG